MTSLGSAATLPPARVRGRFAAGWWPVPDPSRTHSGQWKPTDASIMQSVQIGLSHRVQRIPVSLSGCR